MKPGNIVHHMWVEKYRPNKLESVILPDDFKTLLSSLIQNGKIPSLLFYSRSPGTGKTTTARAMCEELGVTPLFINASVNNSVDDIRTTVIQYATTMSVTGNVQKVVILDEADRLSAAAQDALKGIIENVSNICAFILTCNNKAKIIEPLQSRMTTIDFVYTKEQQGVLSAKMLKRSFEILDLEGVPYDRKSVAHIVKQCVPDNRRLLSILQQYANQYKSIDSGVVAFASRKDDSTFLEALRKKDFPGMLQWCADNAEQIGDDFYHVVYNKLFEHIVDNSKPGFILILNEFQRYHTIVPDKYLHFVAMATRVMLEVDFK